MNTLEELKELRKEASPSYPLLVRLLDILIAEREGREKVEVDSWPCDFKKDILCKHTPGKRTHCRYCCHYTMPEIRPIVGEMWEHEGNTKQSWYIKKSDIMYHNAKNSYRVSTIPDDVIHGKSGWKLIWSPDPQRMKLIQEEKK